MPKIRTSRTKRPPEGYEEIEEILDEYAKKMRDAENESHEGKRKAESLWPIMRISHTRSRYIYELYYKREAISRELYDWLLKEGYADANLIAKWKKTGYEKLCCLRCIQTKDMNYQGSTCVCRVPKANLRTGTVVQCNHCDASSPLPLPPLLASAHLLDQGRKHKNGERSNSVARIPPFTLIFTTRSDMGELSGALISLVSRAAAEQGGVISGDNPSKYSKADPIKLWIIQVIVILAMTQLLSLILGRIRQPRVIAEVIGGVLLGPTVLGRAKGFSATIFPDPTSDSSLTALSLTANIGLVLFLFLVGLELDVRIIKKNAKASAVISLAGLILPLGLGAALGVGVYREFVDPKVNFGYFILFVAVAIGITAFPVLCRILTELKLLDTTVGAVGLAAGVGNDVVGWILLALAVALANASQPLTALYVLLACVGYVIFLLYPVRWGYRWLCKTTGSLEQGTPTAFTMTITILLVFSSAFFTDIIGVHAIFGGFLAGLIIPHDNGYAISLVEKLEDLVSILFLPLYFTLSGLRTNLGLLNNGITWAYVVIICVVAFFSKFIACAGSAYAFGFNWREAGAIGSLMSCKGLVELIVLNIGLQAGILDTRTFSMFVLHAIVLTFMTTPLVLLFYPESVRVHEGHHTAGIDKKHGKGGDTEAGGAAPRKSAEEGDIKTSFSLIMDKTEQLPAAMTISQLLHPAQSSSSVTLASSAPSTTPGLEEKVTTGDIPELSKSPAPSSPLSAKLSRAVTISALRLIELTNRTSAVIKSQEADLLLLNDPLISIFRTFGLLNRVRVNAALSVVMQDEFANAVVDHARDVSSEMVVVPWARGTVAYNDAASEVTDTEGGARNPFDGVFSRSTAVADQTTSVVYSEFIRSVFLKSPADVALFVDRGLCTSSFSGSGASIQTYLYLPFFGGPDDRLALAFVVQLVGQNPAGVSATVVRYSKSEGGEGSDGESVVNEKATTHQTLGIAGADTVYGAQNTETRIASDTKDNVVWEKFSSASSSRGNGGNVRFETKASPTPLAALISAVSALSVSAANGSNGQSMKNVIVVCGRSRRLAAESLSGELKGLMAKGGSAGGEGEVKMAQVGSSVPRTLGDVGAGLVASGTRASLLVVQAKHD